jgi:hypothetical protein
MGMRLASILLVVLLGAALLTGVATARTAAVPQNTSPPSIGGAAREGNTLTARNGTWTNAPTSFAYQWQRCAPDGTGCTDISGAADRTYTLASADADHTVRVQVTAKNADGLTTASSAPTAVVSSRSAPVNTAKPTISGTAKVGEELSATNGTWSGGATSFTYQWQRCTSSSSCADVDGATSRTYGVRSADVGDTLRVAVTAHNASGSTATAYADQTATVTSNSSTTTVVTTRNNRPPSVTFISLRRAGTLIYSRFRVCDDSTARVRVTERDTKPGALAYKRTFLVKAKPCLTYSRHWGLAARFRHGRYTATLQARDRQGATSAIRTRTLVFR